MRMFALDAIQLRSITNIGIVMRLKIFGIKSLTRNIGVKLFGLVLYAWLDWNLTCKAHGETPKWVAHGSYILSSRGSSVCRGFVRDRKGFFIKGKIISPFNALVAGLLAILSSFQFC
ncbi:hypothetical protein MtrunA17_Chr7g0223281 [Medicago truncatula]|uniref:Transmembrane protein, putative n=1 Tax=Medicago truncatula TaxID=3880 RepID=G7KXT8_MEDTR|nr:transmembrane protein, putative [Medicago truncatula]RHN44794.1 hypothetical protein MtrunA17_Chr7g0223281 [Medicago truncatula]